MLFNWKSGLLFCLLLISLSTVSAAEVPTAAISAEAGIVIRLKQPQATLQKMTQLTSQVDEAISGLLAANVRTVVGRSLSNPTWEGVDPARTISVGVFLHAEQDPGLLFIVPVKDVDACKAALGEKYHSTLQDKWLIYSEDQKLVEQAQASLKQSDQSFESQLSPAAKGLFDSGDLSVYLNLQKMVQIYQAQLKRAEGQVDRRLTELAKTMNAAPGVNAKPILSLYSTLAKGSLQAVKDSHAYTTAFQFSEQGVGLESLFEVKPDSETDQLFQSNPPQPLNQLGHFPAHQLAYIAGAGNADALITWGMNMTAQMFDETQQNAEAKEKFTEIVKEIRSLKFGSYYFSFELGKLADGVMHAYTVSEVTPSDKLRTLTHQMMQIMQNISLPGIKQEITFKPDAEQAGGIPVDLTVIKQELDPASDPLQIQKRMLEILYGPSGITNRMAYPEGKVLQVMGGSASMQKFMEALNAPDKSSLTAQNQSAFQKARAHGAEKANLVALVDVSGTVMRILNIFAESRQQTGPFAEKQIRELGIQDSYLTFSLTTGKQSLSTKTYIPVENLQNGFKVYSLISRQK